MKIETSYKTTERFIPRVRLWGRKFISQNFMGTEITILPL